MKEHRFGEEPLKVVWLQIAGLDEEHLALIKFGQASNHSKMAMEELSCMGKSWNFNLFSLRPSAYQGFHDQVTGRKTAKGTCEDFSARPIWSYLSESNFSSTVMEVSAYEQSISKANSCAQPLAKDYLKNTTLLKVEPATKKGSLSFHSKEKGPFEIGQVYYDQSCSRKSCFSGLSTNFISSFERALLGERQIFFLLRDYSYLKAIQTKQIQKAKDILGELDKITRYLLEKQSKGDRLLLLITGSSTLPIEFPSQGKQWREFDRNKKNLLYKRSSLLSPVFAYGPRSENFCGLFEGAELMTRILKNSKRESLEITIRDPFN